MNRFGLFYIDSNGQKYLYKSYKTLEALYYDIEHDEYFNSLDVKEIIVIELEESNENNY